MSILTEEQSAMMLSIVGEKVDLLRAKVVEQVNLYTEPLSKKAKLTLEETDYEIEMIDGIIDSLISPARVIKSCSTARVSALNSVNLSTVCCTNNFYSYVFCESMMVIDEVLHVTLHSAELNIEILDNYERLVSTDDSKELAYRVDSRVKVSGEDWEEISFILRTGHSISGHDMELGLKFIGKRLVKCA